MTSPTLVAEPTAPTKITLPSKTLITAAAMGASYIPLLYLHAVQLWQNEEHQYFPFILAAVGYLIWTRFRTAEKRDPRYLKLSFAISLVVVAWLLLAFALLTYTTWLAYLSALAVSAAMFAVLSQQYQVTNLWGIWFLLALISPLPHYVHQDFVHRLQSMSSGLSSQVLDLIGIDHLMEGNILRFPNKDFFVDEACSGVVSVMAVLAASSIYAVWRNRSLLHMILLLCCGVIAAVAMNVVRISAVALVHAKWEWDWSTGLSHELLGFSTFGGTFVAMVSVDCVLRFLLDPIPVRGKSVEEAQNALVRAWNRLVTSWSPAPTMGYVQRQRALPQLLEAIRPMFQLGFVAAVAFGALAVLQSVTLARAVFHRQPDLAAALAVEEGFLPETLSGFRRQGFDSVKRSVGSEYGDFSKIFRYLNQRTGAAVTVSFDFPFNRGWHELSVCYLSSGWTMTHRDVRPAVLAGTQDEWNYVAAGFSKPTGEHGYLVFSSFDEEGTLVSPPATSAWEKVWRRIWRRNPNVLSNRMLQFQVWIESTHEIDEPTRQEIDNLMLELRPSFLALFTQSR